MKKGEIYEGIVKRVDFPNKGKIECDEGEVVVKNVIPGQRIRFMITKKRSGKCEGRLLEVIDKSKELEFKNLILKDNLNDIKSITKNKYYKISLITNVSFEFDNKELYELLEKQLMIWKKK